MLTRIELDGFKTFSDIAIDLAPFSVILGPNASGKSNLFDAIHLLSNIASMDLRSAIAELRGDADELFRQSAGTSVERMRFAVEVLIDASVRDHWGAEVSLKHTRIRYEVTIAMRREDKGVSRLVVEHELARPILSRDDTWCPYGRKPSSTFKQSHILYNKKSPWLTTQLDEQGAPTSFLIYQDGNAGTKRTYSALAAEATVLSSITTAEFPHLFALRQELHSWRSLQLDPAGLRRPSPVHSQKKRLLPDGSNLASVLARIKADTAEDTRPEGDLADITAQLASIIPGVVRVEVEEDGYNREHRAYLTMRDQLRLPTRVASDGTLRVLALLTLLYDPSHRGVVCFEEPENGIHPARLRSLVVELAALVSQPQTEEDDDEPLAQLLMNSHSPVVLSALSASHDDICAQIMFADMVNVTTPGHGEVERRTRIRPVYPAARQANLLPPAHDQPQVSNYEVEQYLRTVAGDI